MKLRITFIAMTFCFMACNSNTTERLSEREYFSRFKSLAEALRFYPGLMISGAGSQTKVVLRKNVSMQNQEPLYVVDGFPVGNNYARANHMINMAEVTNIRLLSHASELNTYGPMASAGVIEIKTIKTVSTMD